LIVRLNLIYWGEIEGAQVQMAKLYRKQMAELAGMTPVQYDYFVRLGAFAPDLGDHRKHFSPQEAALALIAGQLMPNFKDQRMIVEVLDEVRRFSNPDQLESPAYRTLDREQNREEIREFFKDREEMRLLDPHDIAKFFPEMLTDEYLEGRIEREAARLFINANGFTFDLPRKEIEFMRFLCGNLSKEFEAELEAFKNEVRHLHKEPTGHLGLSHSDLVFRVQYYDAIMGRADFFLQVAGNSDGSIQVRLDDEPQIFPDRTSWTTLSLGKIFQRLAPYIEFDFFPSAKEYWETCLAENSEGNA
tara:strand:+ start:1921 stop:2829 length:909 start_codon:yes stop_codon:yes gene_type:complete